MKAFSQQSRICKEIQSCPGTLVASITFGVVAALISLGMVILWTCMESFAEKVDIGVAHVLFICLIVAFGNGALVELKSGIYSTIIQSPLVNIAYFVAIGFVLMLCVFYWSTINFKKSAQDAKDIAEKLADNAQATLPGKGEPSVPAQKV